MRKMIKELEKEGFTELRVCQIEAGFDSGKHTHEQHTVHVILDGELVISDKQGTRTFYPGDRVEFPVGTTHTARSSKKGSMIVGVKK